jgi:DNA-directed RNA polymerase specialized sigma24 family protein
MMDAEKIVAIVEAAARSCRLWNQADFEDLKQDAAVAVLLAVPKLDERNPEGYLYQVARNRMLSQLRLVGTVRVEYEERHGTVPARLQALGEWWAERVRAEVAKGRGGRIVARLWGLEGEPEKAEALAAELGIKTRCIHQEAWRAMRRLRKSKAIRELNEIRISVEN